MESSVKKFPHLTTLEVTKEVENPEPVTGTVTGEIPHWLNGSWFRNGPGILHFKQESVKHWFDGMALLRKFHFENGVVTYTSRLLHGDSMQKNTAAGCVVVSELYTSANKNGIFRRLKSFLSLPELTDNCLINFLPLGGHLCAITESNFTRNIDPVTLKTREKVDLAKHLPISLMSSHPLVDADGSVFTFSTSVAGTTRTRYNLIKILPCQADVPLEEVLKRAVVVGSIDSKWFLSPSYYHSFAMSQNFAIFIEMPMKMNIPKMAIAHLRHISYSECIDWRPEIKTRIHLVDKRTGKRFPAVFETDPLVVYHYINAFEEDGHVVLDMCCYQGQGFYEKFLVENLEEGPQHYWRKFGSDDKIVRATRFILPLIEDTSLCDKENLVRLSYTNCAAKVVKFGEIFCSGELLVSGTENPTINNKYLGRKYKYFYSSGGLSLPPGEMLTKIDVEKKRRIHTWKEKGCWTSEALFLQRPGAVSEDDGE
ncbi:unnamed protein product [Clavelina lepadiformis]|uniref:Uncharacterized protein n=1 Tax=Clavelina lepadiformis TaxID=159417 RepID=A0ABP0F4B3_CLALP